MKKTLLLSAFLIVAITLPLSCDKNSSESPAEIEGGSGEGSEDPSETGSSEDEESQESGTITLVAKADYLDGNGSGAQTWDEGVSLSAFKIDGSPAEVVFDTEFSDHGFGVRGARWNQIDYYTEYQGSTVNASEKLLIEFNGPVSDVILTIGMLGLNEGLGEDDETGKWTGYDENGAVVAEGIFGPDDSDLGPGEKIEGYGQYPFTLESSSPFHSVAIEATGFAYGQGDPRYVNSYNNESGNKENNSDFNLMAVSFKRP